MYATATAGRGRTGGADVACTHPLTQKQRTDRFRTARRGGGWRLKARGQRAHRSGILLRPAPLPRSISSSSPLPLACTWQRRSTRGGFALSGSAKGKSRIGLLRFVRYPNLSSPPLPMTLGSRHLLARPPPALSGSVLASLQPHFVCSWLRRPSPPYTTTQCIATCSSLLARATAGGFQLDAERCSHGM